MGGPAALPILVAGPQRIAGADAVLGFFRGAGREKRRRRIFGQMGVICWVPLQCFHVKHIGSKTRSHLVQGNGKTNRLKMRGRRTLTASSLRDEAASP